MKLNCFFVLFKNSSKYKWYCLLPESIGKHKRMALNVEHSTKKLSANKKSNSNGLILNVRTVLKDETCLIFENFSG